METFALKTRARFFQLALRQMSYTNYTAIADIIDNSIEPYVGARNVYVNLTKTDDRKSVKEIIVADDGCGMDDETLRMAMSLGSDTGKTSEDNLGKYGTGFKAASYSIGRELSVYARVPGGELLKAMCNLDEISDDGEIIVHMDSIIEGTSEFTFFTENTKCDHGTVVIVSKLDNLQNKDYYGFENTLTKQLRILFNKYIEANIQKFYVNGKKLTFFDLIGDKSGLGTELLDKGEFKHNGATISWKAWYLPKLVQKGEFKDFLGRSMANQGMYLYRQNRLVGKGLDLGMCHKNDAWANGFRFELFMDGNSDKLFSTTFTKMIDERGATSIEQSFYNKLETIVSPLVKQCMQRQRKNDGSDKKIPEGDEKIFDQATEMMNRNILLSTKARIGLNKNTQEHTEKHDTTAHKPKTGGKPKPKQNTSKSKICKWFGGYEYVDESPFSFMYNIAVREAKAYVQININHPFYTEMFCHLNDESKYRISAILSCKYLALQDCGYWTDESARKIVDNCDEHFAEAVRLAFHE